MFILYLTTSLNLFIHMNNLLQVILLGFQVKNLRIVLHTLFRHMIDCITNVYSICCPTVRVMFLKVIWQKNLWLRKRGPGSK